MELTFEDFFTSLHSGKKPFPWQVALANRVTQTKIWPKILDLPTGSGKTSCLDVALYAMLHSKDAPRRVFFVVDRRVVVNEAYLRTKQIAKTLESSDNPILMEARRRLIEMGGGSSGPLHVSEMRGGIYRDSAWVNNPLQPTIVLSTVDQVGSRLLFRGYGVSSQVSSIHAALIANNSLLILDEAHTSRPFAQTLERVERFLGEEGTLRIVQMTATPASSAETFQISAEDRANETLSKRLQTAKPTKIVTSKSRSDQSSGMAKDLVTQAVELQKQTGHKRILIMANRIATAKAAAELLEKEKSKPGVQLIIGRMRPLDRDDLLGQLSAFKTGSNESLDEPHYIVSTQCLEVGADLDFEILVTEAASIDALLQRFGRLDRAGKLIGNARGAILFGPSRKDKPDPIYGEALAQVTEWFQSREMPEVDMGLESSDGQSIPALIRSLSLTDSDKLGTMRQPAKRAAVLLPAHIDALAQTGPVPEPSPDVSLFLHGVSDENADVQVIWRADLPEQYKDWPARLALCPPSSPEAMPVRIAALRSGLSDPADSDIEGLEGTEAPSGKSAPKHAELFVWQGDRSSVRKVLPGDTVILRCEEGNWKALGHIPGSGLANGLPLDYGDRANHLLKNRSVLRLAPAVLAQTQFNTPNKDLLNTLVLNPLTDTSGDPLNFKTIKPILEYYKDNFELPKWLSGLLQSAIDASKPQIISDGLEGSTREALHCALSWPRKKIKAENQFLLQIEEDAESDELSFVGLKGLKPHTDAVKKVADRFAADNPFRTAVHLAAHWHDFGKADFRFQTMLHGGDSIRAGLFPVLLAKGDSYNPKASQMAGLPHGFRHEMLSLAAAQKAIDHDTPERDLILHLIASHHGHGRPFAPVVIDDAPTSFEFNGAGFAPDNQIPPAHALSSGVARRYWALTRRLGWWRLAYLETLLRLADWNASASQQESE